LMMRKGDPDGWKKTSLGEVASTQLGKAINPKESKGPNQRPYLRNANVQWDRFDLNDVLTMHFSESEVERLQLEPGDLLTCEGGIVGRSAIWQGEIENCCFQNALHRIRPLDQEVSAEWLLENLRYLTETGVLASRARGNTIQHISQQELRNLPVVVPDREEQDQIIAVLNRTRALRSSALRRLDGSRSVIGRVRQSILSSACSGRLTIEWRLRHQCESAEDEIERSNLEAQKVRRGVDATLPALEYPGIPETWTSMTAAQLLCRGVLVDLKDGNHGAVHPKVSEFTDDGLPFITANLVRHGEIDYDSAPRVDGAVLARLRVGFSQPGDVVLTHKGTVGRVAVATSNAVLTPQTTYYRCAPAVLDPGYLVLFFSSLYFYEQLARVMSQTTRDFVPITQQYRLSVILPPISEQREIIRRVNGMFNLVREIEHRIERAQSGVERSAQAVLVKGFRGELTTLAAAGHR
jgi:type I restriction enzyme, S subunit